MHTLPARPKAAVTVCVCLSFSLASSSDSAATSATAAAAAAATAETAELWTKPLPPAADGNLTASAAVAVLNREALRVVSQESVPALRFALSEINSRARARRELRRVRYLRPVGWRGRGDKGERLDSSARAKAGGGVLHEPKLHYRSNVAGEFGGRGIESERRRGALGIVGLLLVTLARSSGLHNCPDV